MPRGPLAAAVVVALLQAPAFAAAVAPSSVELARLADAELARAYPAGAPGAAVLVRRGGEVVLRKGYGLAQLDHGIPAAPEQVFQIGSVTKQFTAAAILRLAEQGKLALADPISRFLPDFPTGDHTVTLEHLLTHTSGLPNYTDLAEWIPRWREDMSLETLIGLFRGRPLEFAPGELWNYSNSGYVLLGATIEKVTGRSYEDFVESELLAPLGMSSSRYGHQEEVVAGRASGYVKGPNGWVNAPYLSLTQPYAAGSLMSTVDDLARWSDALEEGRVVSPASRDRMFTPAVLRGGEQDGVSTRYGFGNAITTVAGRPAHEHGGGIHGFLSDLLRVPDGDLLIVILSNNPAVDPHATAHRVAELAFGGPEPPAPTLAVAPERLDDYVGVYRVAERANERRVVTRAADGLRMQRTGGSLNPLRPIGPDLFEVGDAETTARFRRDGAGRVVGIEVDSGMGPVFRSPRTDESLPAERQVVSIDPATFDALVGVYVLAPGFDLTVTREGDRLFAQATGQERLEMLPEAADRFFFREVDAQIEFVRSATANTATSLVFHQGGENLTAPRKP